MSPNITLRRRWTYTFPHTKNILFACPVQFTRQPICATHKICIWCDNKYISKFVCASVASKRRYSPPASEFSLGTFHFVHIFEAISNQHTMESATATFSCYSLFTRQLGTLGIHKKYWTCSFLFGTLWRFMNLTCKRLWSCMIGIQMDVVLCKFDVACLLCFFVVAECMLILGSTKWKRTNIIIG